MQTRDQTLPDHYRELEVPVSASPEAIKTAYTRLARVYHPDLNHDAGAAARMRRINEAYAVLGVPFQRRTYDLQRLTERESALENASASHPSPTPIQPTRPTPMRRRETRLMRRRLPEPAVLMALLRRPSVRRAGAYLAAAVAGGTLVGGLVAGGVLHGNGRSVPVTSSPAAGAHTVRVISPVLSTPPPASSAPLPPTPPPPTMSPAPQVRAVDLIVGAAQRFATVERLTDARRLAPNPDRGWAFQINGCTIYTGEFDSADRQEAARRYWQQQSARFVAESGPGVVVAVGDCDSPQHQFDVLDFVHSTLTRQ